MPQKRFQERKAKRELVRLRPPLVIRKGNDRRKGGLYNLHQKVSKQFHPDTCISSKAMGIMNKKPAVSSLEIQTPIRLLLPRVNWLNTVSVKEQRLRPSTKAESKFTPVYRQNTHKGFFERNKCLKVTTNNVVNSNKYHECTTTPTTTTIYSRIFIHGITYQIMQWKLLIYLIKNKREYL